MEQDRLAEAPEDPGQPLDESGEVLGDESTEAHDPQSIGETPIEEVVATEAVDQGAASEAPTVAATPVEESVGSSEQSGCAPSAEAAGGGDAYEQELTASLPHLYELGQVAHRLGIDKAAVLASIDARQVGYYALGGRIMLALDDVTAWLKTHYHPAEVW